MSQTKTQHTPGPWKYDGEFVSARVQPSNAHYPGDTVPATICELSPFPEWEANARLIASAPDLLAAATLALEMIEQHGLDECDGEPTNAARDLRAAIARAGGR